jgi:hypothetical protein
MKKDNWIKIEPGCQMPDKNAEVLVIMKKTNGQYACPFNCTYRGNKRFRSNYDNAAGCEEYSHRITHWMPLPEPPKD